MPGIFATLRRLDPLNLIVWAERKGSLVEVVVSWLLIPFLLLRFVLVALPIVLGLTLFWTVPTVVWLTSFRHVGLRDAAGFAVFAANGRPEYEGPFGINSDPATLGFFAFTVVGWVALLALPALAVWVAATVLSRVRDAPAGTG
jgi:hypothetical protein